MVSWQQHALNELAQIWMTAPDQQAVTDAANRLEVGLRSDPDQTAIPMSGGDWLLIELPLAVIFRMFPSDCRVIVSRVWHF
jgi:hypothetical protein